MSKNMRSLTILLLITYLRVNCQSVKWLTPEPYKCHYSQSNAIVNDKAGNIFMIRDVYGGIGEKRGIHFVKYDNNGNRKWQKWYNGYGYVGGLCIDVAGMPFVTLSACPLVIDGVEYNSAGVSYSRCYLGKFDQNGTLQKIRLFEAGLGLTKSTDSNGNLVGIGLATYSFSFDNQDVEPGGFISHFDTDLKLIDNIRDGRSSMYYQCDDKDNIYSYDFFSGSSTESATLGSVPSQTIVPKANSYYTSFKNNGELRWVVPVKGSNLIAPDGFGNAYIVENGNLCKYDNLGKKLWTRTFFNTEDWYSGFLRTGLNGDVYFAGGFTQFLQVDQKKYNRSDGYSGAFVAKFDSAGTCKWVLLSQGAGFAGIKDMVVDGKNLYINADAIGEVTFGGHAYNQEEGVFTAKIVDDNSNLLGVSEDDLRKSSMTIFPNPSDRIFSVKFSEVSEKGVLRVVNINGQLVFQESIDPYYKNATIIDLSKDAKGVYFITLSTSQAVETKTIVLR
jgi:hypothetical protein